MVPGLVGKYGRAYNTLRALGPKDYVDEGVDHENKFYYEVTRTECVYIPNEKVLYAQIAVPLSFYNAIFKNALCPDARRTAVTRISAPASRNTLSEG